MAGHGVELTLEELVQIVCGGNIDGELQEKVAKIIRADPEFAEQFADLEAMAAAAGADDLWDGLERHQDVDRLLAAETWQDPAEVLNPEGSDLYEVSYRKLLAVADARIAAADPSQGQDPSLIEALRDRLQKAEEKLAADSVFQVAEALRNLSDDTAEKVIGAVRRKYWKREGIATAALNGAVVLSDPGSATAHPC